MAQVAKTQVVQLTAIASGNDKITLKWPNDAYLGNYVIHHRDFVHGNNQWKGPDATLPGSVTSWTDTMSLGQTREYRVMKVKGTASEAFGYIYAGNQFKRNPNRGGIVLMIDSSYIRALKTEIVLLSNDLLADGWFPSHLYIGRNEKVDAVKTKLEAHMKSQNLSPKALYILGHVPVPYSGNFSTNGDRPPPDGHVEGAGNHTGAWPSDVYYGTLNCYWGDDLVTCTTGSETRHKNIPGDGKFDQSAPECPILLEIGRVDLFAMDAFSKNDTQLVRDYLGRVHNYKMGMGKFRRRGLIDNNFTGLNLASTGYHNFPCFVGLDSFSDATDYFTEQNNGSYLWSYGCGAGSYSSCNGVGTTNDFVTNQSKFKNAFTLLAGSYFGDWDSKNNLLRASLAGGSLASCWGGIPKWYLHHMGLGLNIGYGAKITQNNVNDYFNGAFNYSWNGVFIALMGDPTLNMHYIKPPTALTVTENNGTSTLRWNKTGEKIDGYMVYRIDLQTLQYKEIGSFCTLVNSTTQDTFFIDYCKPTIVNPLNGNFKYAVRAFKIETTGSGSYQNLSLAAIANPNYTAATTNNVLPIFSLYPNPSNGKVNASNLSPNQPYEAEIFNAMGKIVCVKQGVTDNNGQLTLLLTTAINGVFDVSVKINQTTHNSKLVVLH